MNTLYVCRVAPLWTRTATERDASECRTSNACFMLSLERTASVSPSVVSAFPPASVNNERLPPLDSMREGYRMVRAHVRTLCGTRRKVPTAHTYGKGRTTLPRAVRTWKSRWLTARMWPDKHGTFKEQTGADADAKAAPEQLDPATRECEAVELAAPPPSTCETAEGECEAYPRTCPRNATHACDDATVISEIRTLCSRCPAHPPRW